MHDSQHQAQRRTQILTAAERVFDQHGYAAATVGAVATEAGIAKGSIYNYFKSKEELFKAVFTNVLVQAESEVDRRIQTPLPARQKLEQMLDYWFENLSRHNRIGRLVLEFWATAAREGGSGELTRILQQMYSQWRERIASIVDEGVSTGEFNPQFDKLVAASLIMAMLDGIEIQSILDVGVNVDTTLLAAMKRAILTGLSVARNEEP